VRVRIRLLMLFAACLGVYGQTGPVNPDLEKGTAGSVPEGWKVSSASRSFTAVWVAEGCTHGTGCARIAPKEPAASGPGNLMQTIDAAPYRGKLIRYRAAVKVEGSGYVGLWLRVDRPAGARGFFDNMQLRPIRTGGQWQYFTIDGWVNADATQIGLGVLVYGGAAGFDDVSLEATGDLPAGTSEAARPLSDAGLRNLTAFTKLFGIVRHFHPSDEAMDADWNRIAVEGVRKVEGAGTPRELAAALQEVFRPAAPTLQVFTGEATAANVPTPSGTGAEVVRIHNKGFGQGQELQNQTYIRQRVRTGREVLKPEDVYRMDLGGGVTALVPLALLADAQGTLPHGPAAKMGKVPLAFYSGDDRATRMADVAIVWNVMRHFYPYFDVVGTDWDAVLPEFLRAAATDKDGLAFHDTLLRMISALRDGHGRLAYALQKPQARVAATASWIEGKYIVTWSAMDGLKPGDAIVTIGGKPSAQVLEELEKLISGATPQWKRVNASSRALLCPAGEKLTLTVRSFGAAEDRPVTAACDYRGAVSTDARPKEVSKELEPGIWYFDLTRGTDSDFAVSLADLAKAKGIVFDMRGYPRVSGEWFTHTTQTTMHSPQWHIPVVDRPGEMKFSRGGEWTLPSKPPYLAAKKVFLTNGTAISYAETTMGIVEAYKLGEIVGETTAGTNGNINPFEVPGGYTVTWTGMKVLKNDGSQHHGVGIRPTIPSVPTQAGVAAGRDEVLERGVAVLKQ
jgi:C-terminal processing protease CtpA/Prc